MKIKVFVTGAGGFVGSHLVPMLLDAGFEVTSLVKSEKEKKLLPTNRVVIVGDLSRYKNWPKALKGHQVLVHLAAEISSKNKQAFVRNNTVATRNLIKAAKAAKISKIILFSSAAVTSIRKDDYAKTKADQEEIVVKSKISYNILRPSMIYGPKDTKNIGWLIRMVSRLPIIPLPGGGHFGRQPVYVKDICQVVIKLAMENYKDRIFEIHGKDYITMAQMVKTILGKTKRRRLTLPIPLGFLLLAFWLGERILNNPKFTTDQIKSLISGEKFTGDSWWKTFDIIPTSFEKGVQEMVKKKN